ncbi:hypothetical protein ACV1C4_22665 [Aeromonas hydrophila]|uniref:hypothetical protein n=1 Tax=Aeromonas hydrophila TaxID=644 RepID=UPI003EC60D0A
MTRSHLGRSQALELLADSHESLLSMKELLFVWDRVSTCLDHQHAGDSLDTLLQFEQELADMGGTYQVLNTGE